MHGHLDCQPAPDDQYLLQTYSNTVQDLVRGESLSIRSGMSRRFPRCVFLLTLIAPAVCLRHTSRPTWLRSRRRCHRAQSPSWRVHPAGGGYPRRDCKGRSDHRSRAIPRRAILHWSMVPDEERHEGSKGPGMHLVL